MHSVTINFPTHLIPFWFLVVSLFIPRISLLIMWLQGAFPVIPILDVIAAIVVPRLLILIWIYNDQGISGWFILHAIVMIAAFAGGGHRITRRRGEL